MSDYICKGVKNQLKKQQKIKEFRAKTWNLYHGLYGGIENEVL